jgi:xylitol oxidase
MRVLVYLSVSIAGLFAGGISKLLPVLEKELAPFHARPHWGKLFMTSSTVLRGAYKRMPEFIELSRKYDPEGKFRNEFLNKNIFGN